MQTLGVYRDYLKPAHLETETAKRKKFNTNFIY